MASSFLHPSISASRRRTGASHRHATKLPRRPGQPAVLGERACACIVLRPGQSLTLEQLVEFLQGREVANYKLPERLELFDDLPKNTGAKLAKAELRSMVMEQIDRAPVSR